MTVKAPAPTASIVPGAADALAAHADAMDFTEIVPQSEYFDGNGHLNAGYYSVLMDRAAELSFRHLGMGWEYVQQTGISQFCLTSRIVYRREILQGQPIDFAFRIIDVDSKKAHYHLTMLHAGERWTAATYEALNICVDISERRSAIWPETIRNTLDRLLDVHRLRPMPEGVGDRIAIRSPKAPSN